MRNLRQIQMCNNRYLRNVAVNDNNNVRFKEDVIVIFE